MYKKRFKKIEKCFAILETRIEKINERLDKYFLDQLDIICKQLLEVEDKLKEIEPILTHYQTYDMTR